MLDTESNLQKVRDTFINNGEYEFPDAEAEERYAKRLLFRIEESYSSENYHREYATLAEFIFSDCADKLAYWLYEDGNY